VGFSFYIIRKQKNPIKKQMSPNTQKFFGKGVILSPQCMKVFKKCVKALFIGFIAYSDMSLDD
jgi:hypothetical protein